MGQGNTVKNAVKFADDLLITFDHELKNRITPHLAEMPIALRDSILYSVFGSGKRVRPRIVFGIGSALDVAPPILHTLASVVELIHTYTLIHDDLPCMDNDDFRRGKPTNHKIFGEATALLAGDALMALSIDVLVHLTDKLTDNLFTESEFSKSLDDAALEAAVLKAVKLSSYAMGGKAVIKGQCGEHLLNEEPGLSRLLDVFRAKTGALFALSFMLPALFRKDAAARGLELARLRSLGETLGIAFQIADDLEDEKVSHAPPIHIRAYLSDEEAIEWIRKARLEQLGNLPSDLNAIRDFTDSLFQAILEKCENAQKK